MLVIIPMVGRGTRTKDCWNLPKPLIEVNGKPLIQHSVESLAIPGQYIFIIREFTEYPNGKEHTDALRALLLRLQPSCKIYTVPEVTDGPARSALVATDTLLAHSKEPLMITNCDQVLNWDPQEFLSKMESTKCDGCVTTYPHVDDVTIGGLTPYSFIKLDSEDKAVQLEEKVAISRTMLNGIHYWNHAEDFVNSANEMIAADDRVRGEFYVSKSYNYLIDKGKRIIHYPMKKGEFSALGTTGEITTFLEK